MLSRVIARRLENLAPRCKCGLPPLASSLACPAGPVCWRPRPRWSDFPVRFAVPNASPKQGIELGARTGAEFDQMSTNSFPIILILLSLTTIATAAPNKGNPLIAGNDVTWQTLGTNENSSMPFGS